MLDFAQLASVDIKHLSEDEADNWCERILKFSPTSSESRDQLLSLFSFTQSLLKVKTIQTDVLIEELQAVGSRLDAVNQELDRGKAGQPEVVDRSDELVRLQGELESKEDELEEAQLKTKRLEESTRAKDREIGSLRIELDTLQQELREAQRESSSSRGDDHHSGTSGTSESGQLADTRSKLAEANAQIEQLLDRIYDTDRINLDLAESLAKHRLEGAKHANEQKISQSKVEMLSIQVDEFRRLNESLLFDRDRKEQEIAAIRAELEQRSVALLGVDHQAGSSTSSAASTSNFYHELSSEIKRLNLLLEAKQTEIVELRAALQEITQSDRSLLEQKHEEIQRLEEELSIVTSTSPKPGSPSPGDADDPEESSLLVRQLRRRIRKLRKEKLNLLERLGELEKEAGTKDADLERQRRKTLALLGSGQNGDGSSPLKQLLEENAVLSRMIKFRDEKISALVDQLNRHHLVAFRNGGDVLGDPGSPKDQKAEIPLMDQLIAVSVERDLLLKQLDALQSHLATVQRENLELQLGMKEILDGLRAGDTASDLVIECPALERACVLLENRLIYPIDVPGSPEGSAGVDLSKVILLKSELDFVRGQNEQLRAELKQLRGDFLAVIDEYTNDILENWTLPVEETGQTGQKSEMDTLESASQTTLSSVSQNTGSQTLDDPASDDPKPDLLQAYYQQLRRFQMKSSLKRKSSSSKKPKKTKRLSTGSGSGKDPGPGPSAPVLADQTHSSTQTEPESDPETPQPKLKLTDSSSQTDNPAQSAPESVPESPQEPTQPQTQSSIKELLFENPTLRDALLADQEIQAFIIENHQFLNRLIQEDPELRQQLLQNQEIVQTLLGDPAVHRMLQEEYQVQNRKQPKPDPEPKNQQQPEVDADEYVEMYDVAVQVKPRIENEWTQTAVESSPPVPASSVPESVPKPCPSCSKYIQMLTTIRGLIEKERKQSRLQEVKLQEQVDALKGNLKLVQSEYKLDLEARTEELRDLRQKLSKAPERKVVEDKTTVVVDMMEIRKSPSGLDVQNLLETYPSFVELEVTDGSMSSRGPEGKMTKSILETIINCLQNCLKQKDEALAEYRQLMDEMRRSYSNNSNSRAITPSLKSPPDPDPTRSSPSELETIYQELFLKPCSQQNEELMGLLQKTFSELKSSTMKIESLKAEVHQKSKELAEVGQKIEKLTKERAFLEAQVKVHADKETVYLEKIETLNGKVADLSKRTLSAVTLKKKVQNAVFQESADLRSKITQLQAEVKRVELERWTLEKKLATTQANARQKLQERDQVVTTLNLQIEKYQAVLGKLERKLAQAQKNPPPAPVMMVQKPEPETAERATQTTAAKSREQMKVRFEDETMEQRMQQRTVVVQRHQQHKDTAEQVPFQEQQQPEDNSKSAQLIDELQSMLQQALKREKMNAMVREISAVGQDVLTSTTTSTSEDKTTMPTPSGSDPPRSSAPNSATVFMTPGEVYEQLMDMQFERLVSENAQLKVKLRMAELAK